MGGVCVGWGREGRVWESKSWATFHRIDNLQILRHLMELCHANTCSFTIYPIKSLRSLGGNVGVYVALHRGSSVVIAELGYAALGPFCFFSYRAFNILSICTYGLASSRVLFPADSDEAGGC